MERADLSNPSDEIAMGNGQQGAGGWSAALQQLVQIPGVAYAAIWAEESPLVSDGDDRQPGVVAEAGSPNSHLVWQQRLSCWQAAWEPLGNVPLVTHRDAAGTEYLAMSLMVFQQGSRFVGLECQFFAQTRVADGTRAIGQSVDELARLGWLYAAPTSVPSVNGDGASGRTPPAISAPSSTSWVWTGRGGLTEAVPNERLERQVEGGDAVGVSSGQELQTSVDLPRFVRQLHQSLDPQETSYAVANECRRLLGCQRVTVLWLHRGKYLVKAISGQAAVNRRSKWVQLLERLAGAALRAGAGLEYPHREPLPRQLSVPLENYLLESRTRSLLLFPVWERDLNFEEERVDLKQRDRRPQRVIAGIVLESLTGEDDFSRDSERLQLIQDLGSGALRSAHCHRQLFLYPLWHFLGRTKAVALARRLPVAAVVGLVLVALAALAFFPATFYVASEGTLVPLVQQRVFAPMDGIVEAVFVRPNDQVGVGQPLLRMRNYDLDVRVRQVEGELALVREQIEVRNRRDRLPTRQDLGYWDQINEMPVSVLESRRANLQTQLALLQQQTMLAVVTSQVSGRVLTWNVHEELKDRPVPMGRLLMEVADTAGRWELELNLPDRRVGHLLKAMEQQGVSLPVEFVMAAEPTRRFMGRVVSVAPVTAASTEEGSYVKVRVELETEDLRVLQTNTDVSAKILCGRASLGYVWLQDVVEFVERQIFFYLW